MSEPSTKHQAPSTAAKPLDIPTVARIRERIRRCAKGGDISVEDCRAAFGLMSKTPIISRIENGTFSAAKVCGVWKIDVDSVERYLDNMNNKGI